ncbi:hypothetical protein ElP_19680 [Tautonia plasticadhaerens]|uniref:Uncharacterized protein n=1 Tax=Tautonia plasticadhaerens TaxID=2527974 RepID=A0A518GZT5_9BACT|nr:hypothetical protein ElP_19680 [Tautonia plasticadhaerens]
MDNPNLRPPSHPGRWPRETAPAPAPAVPGGSPSVTRGRAVRPIDLEGGAVDGTFA